MAKVLTVAMHSSDDPAESSMAFITAIGALGAEIDVSIVLLGEGVYLAREAIARGVHGVGFPPFSELVKMVVAGQVPVYVCGPCSVVRGITAQDLQTLNALFIDEEELAKLVSESSVIGF
jgi:predicted peroxiredoxin